MSAKKGDTVVANTVNIPQRSLVSLIYVLIFNVAATAPVESVRNNKSRSLNTESENSDFISKMKVWNEVSVSIMYEGQKTTIKKRVMLEIQAKDCKVLSRRCFSKRSGIRPNGMFPTPNKNKCNQLVLFTTAGESVAKIVPTATRATETHVNLAYLAFNINMEEGMATKNGICANATLTAP